MQARLEKGQEFRLPTGSEAAWPRRTVAAVTGETTVDPRQLQAFARADVSDTRTSGGLRGARFAEQLLRGIDVLGDHPVQREPGGGTAGRVRPEPGAFLGRA